MNVAYPMIEFHILQSFPVSCLNRDDVGSPKTCMIGGATRARVSSQCWKRAVRLQLHEFGVTLGIRTKKVAERLAAEIQKRVPEQEKAFECASKIAASISDDSLTFLTDLEYQKLAEYAESIAFDPSKVNEKEAQKVIKKLHAAVFDGLDIALFGRMVAKASTMNVEASASFSHAFSTHAVDNELDFFTAIDDKSEGDEARSAHLGANEFNSATYYRYVSLNLVQLAETLGLQDAESIQTAVRTFIQALYVAVPAARQSTMSASRFWDYARIYVRRGQRLQASFEEPVRAGSDGGYLAESIQRLKADLDLKEKQAGSLFGKVGVFEFGESDKSIDSLIAEVLEAVRS